MRKPPSVLGLTTHRVRDALAKAGKAVESRNLSRDEIERRAAEDEIICTVEQLVLFNDAPTTKTQIMKRARGCKIRLHLAFKRLVAEGTLTPDTSGPGACYRVTSC